MTTETTQAAWPEGVIARYLTVGGATVDLTALTYSEGEHWNEQQVSANCTGGNCTQWQTSTARVQDFRDRYATEEQARQRTVDALAKELDSWAQAHAGTCRAMPRPEGS